MNEALWQELVKEFGPAIDTHKEEIEKRIVKSITSIMYAGNVGDNPLCILNRAYENFK